MAISSAFVKSVKVLNGGNDRGRRKNTSSSPSPSYVLSHSNPLRLIPLRREQIRSRAVMVVNQNRRTSSSYLSNLNPFCEIQPLFSFEEEEKRRTGRTSDPVTAEKLDEWMRDSICEIVKNIDDAPFLVQIFSRGTSSLMQLETEEALPENWVHMKKKWYQTSCKPDGVILIKELRGKTDMGNNKTWGLVIQGRGMDCVAPCYILKTCQVKSSIGFCTHFCLHKVACFGEPLENQLRTAWFHGR